MTLRIDEPVHTKDIARRCGVRMQTVSNWRARFDDFPSPAYERYKTTLFEWAEVADWLLVHRLPGTIPSKKPRRSTMSISDHFTSTMRGDERITILTDDAPDWLRDAIYECHDGLPDDWVFDKAESIVEAIEDGYDQHETVDGLVDIYTHDLIEWSKSHVADIDDSCEEYGGDHGFEQRIRIGQYAVLDRMWSTLETAINDNQDDDEEEDDDAGE